MKKLDIKKYIRSCCSNFEPYIAGKPVETIKRELGLKKVIKLASNENPLGPSPKAIAAIKMAAEKVYFYPDSNSWKLRQAISKKFKVSADNIILGSGSDEIIELIAKTFMKPCDEIIVSEHAFIRYKMAGDLMDCRVITVPMRNYTHNLAAMLKAVTPRTKAIFIANPNNPTGTYNTKAEVEDLLISLDKKFPEKPPLVILDEAYYEYAVIKKDFPDTLSYLKKYPNIIVLRTFSKIYSLAGLRVGYGFASKDIFGYIDRIRPPFNVNLAAQVAALASLGDQSQVKRSVQLVAKEFKYLYDNLERLKIPYIPTATNFILIYVGPLSGSDVFKKLLREGVIVRAMDEYDLPKHIRVTVGLPQQNRLFIKKLRKVLNR